MLAERLKIARKTKKLSQESLGELIGLTRTSICNIENGNQYVTYESLLKICNVLEVDPNFLLGFDSNYTPVNWKNEKLKRKIEKLKQDIEEKEKKIAEIESQMEI